MNLKNFLLQSINGTLNFEEQEEFLLQKSDLSAVELEKVVRFLLKLMPNKIVLKNGIDICGTGGSGLNRINSSTISAFVLASLGVKIVKHGNKAASGRFGSFDLIESLNLKILENSDVIENVYLKTNLAFLFAPFFHHVMKHFSEVRKKIGKPTFFNILGPLLSPVQVRKQVIGTPFRDKMDLIAETCIKLGREKVYIVCGNDGLDEVTLTGETFITEVNNCKICKYTVCPENFGVKRCKFRDIQGGGSDFNTKIAIDIIEGRCKSRYLDLILINCALALKLVNKVKTLKEGYEMAKNAVFSGLVYKNFQSYKAAIEIPNILYEIVQNKKKEMNNRKTKLPLSELKKNLRPSTRNFYNKLKNETFSIIAEIKKSSPSSGDLINKGFSPSKIAAIYENAGVAAISVVCDKKFFNGNLKYLEKAMNATSKTPLLCKDFIIDFYQIYEARKYGADAILLIASILTKSQIENFLKIANELKMAVICEVHTKEDVDKVISTQVKIIGINNRDLNSFKVNLGTTKKLALYIDSCLHPKGTSSGARRNDSRTSPQNDNGKSMKDPVIISESGICTRKDIDELPSTVNGVLVGTSLIKSPNMKKKILELKGKNQFMLKICGIKSVTEAKFCENIGVDFIGINFVPTSKRFVSFKTARSICSSVKKIKKVGVFQNQTIDYVNKTASKLDIDYIQLSGDEDLDYIKKCGKPVIKTISIKSPSDIKIAEKYVLNCALILFDGPSPGSGTAFNHKILSKVDFPFMIAGGLNPENVHKVLKSNPYIIDVAGGVEKNGRKSFSRIKLLLSRLHNEEYHN